MEVTPIDIKDQVNQYYRKYALYVLEARGIPNFYDGLTPVQRLVLLNAPDAYSGTIGLIGNVIATGLYHHGDMSLAKSISKLARPFGCAESLLLGHGFFGSPAKPRPASARYTKVKISPFAKQTINENFALNKKNSEGGYEWIHTELPLGLVTHVIGIAVGYSSNILPRKASDVKEYLAGKNKLLKPYFAGYKGGIKKHNGLPKAWLFEGEFTVDNAAMTMSIGDLPPMMRYDSFVTKMFSKIEEHGDSAKVENNSSDSVSINIKWRDRTTWEVLRDEISKMTKMVAIEGLVFIRSGTVVEYEELSDYLDEFKLHKERVVLGRLQYELTEFDHELAFLRAKVLFMKFMMEKKRKSDEVKMWMSDYDARIRVRLDAIKLTALTQETLEEAEDLIKEIIKKIADQKKLITAQTTFCKITEKDFKGKGKVNVNKAVQVFETDISADLDGIDLFNPEEDEEEEIIEEED